VLENYWDYSQPIFPSGQIELQCHNDPIHFRNIFIREIPRDEGPRGLTKEEKEAGFVSLFNGKDLTGWIGDTNGYVADDGKIVCKKGGNVYAKDEYSDFIFRFEFKLTPGANNGLGIRTPLNVNAAYQGMEIQILDDNADQYKNLKPYQYHGSIYGVVPVIRGCQKPVGQWNYQEVMAKGGRIRVRLNGGLVVNKDISNITETMDKRPHPGLHREKGYIGFLGHGSQLEFRNIRIKELK
jgi:hypothetical protein